MERAVNFKELWTKNFKETLNKESFESLGGSLYMLEVVILAVACAKAICKSLQAKK